MMRLDKGEQVVAFSRLTEDQIGEPDADPDDETDPDAEAKPDADEQPDAEATAEGSEAIATETSDSSETDE
jgi:hypothetical protein